ncbi:MAG: DNA repair protein RadC [Dehalococcoidales bacterium]
MKNQGERFTRRGLDDFDDQEIVEILLALHSPTKSHKKQAKDAIKRFKSLRGVMEASADELLQIDGVTPHCIFGVRFLLEVARRFLKERIIDKPIYQSAQEVFDYLYLSMRGLKKEVFKVIYLNSQNQIIDTEDLFVGTINGTSVHPREIIEAAIKHRAVHMIFVHNHPSGDTTATKRDRQLTRDLVYIGNVTQIKVLDHIIIGNNTYFSFADAGLIKKYEDDFLNIRIKRLLEVQPYQYQN